MRVDISIDSGQAASVTATTPAATPAEAVGAADAGPSAVAGPIAIDAGPPSLSLLAEIAAAGGDGSVLGSRWPTAADSQGADAVDAGSAPA